MLLAPAYEIQVDGFIPQEYVPWPGNGIGVGTDPEDFYFYGGDMKKSPLDGIFTSGAVVFNKYLGFTARQKVMATVYAELDPDGSQEKEESNNTPASIIHVTKEYNGTQFTSSGTQNPYDGTAHILPGAVPLHQGVATPQVATVTVTHPSSRVVQAEIKCTVGDPLAFGSGLGPLYYDITVKIDATNPASPTYTLTGNHKLFPAYDVYINQQLVHDYSPIPGHHDISDLINFSPPSISNSSITSGTTKPLTGSITP